MATKSSTRNRRTVGRESRTLRHLKHRHRNFRLSMETLEDRLAPAVQIYGGLEFMTAGSFNTSNNVVTSSSPVQVGVAPAQGGSFAPLVLLQNGVQFTTTDTTGMFTTPPVGASGGAVSADAGTTTVPLLDAHSHTFDAPALLGSGYDVLPSSDVNGADLSVAGGGLAVTGLHFAGPELDLQGNLALPNFPGLSLPVGGTGHVAVTGNGVQLSSLSVDLATSTDFSEAGLKFTTDNVAVQYVPANNEFDLSGSASLAVADNTLSVTLGSSSAPGLSIVDGAFHSLDAAVMSNIKIGGLTFTAQNLTIQATAGSDVTITGTASFALGVAGNTETINVTLGSTDSGGVSHPGIDIDQSTGTLVSLDAAVDTDITIAALDIKANALGIAYDSTDNSFVVSGGASFAFDSATVTILLGGSSSPGLVIQDGQIVSLQAAVSSDVDIFGVKLTVDQLSIAYVAASGDTPSEFVLTGTAGLTVAGNTLSVSLGSDSTPGLVIVNDAVQSFDAAVTSDIKIGGLTFKTQNLTIQESASSNLTITGSASFTLDVAGNMESIAVTLGSTDSGGAMHPGIVINQSTGQLLSLDAVVDADLTIAAVDIKATDLGIAYESSDNSYVISGGASFALDGATVSILLGGAYSPGIVIQSGQLVSLQAAVSGDIDLLGVKITADNLTVVYVAASGPTAAQFDLFGSVGLSSSFVTFNTTLGNEQNPGLVVSGGTLESLNITVSGGFSLFGIDLTADGLTIHYASASNELELSGGVMLDFTSSFEVSAAITQGGLYINTSTGALSVPSTGLSITASANLGPFAIKNLMISFSQGSSGVNFSASGMVDLPGGIDIGLDELDIVNGQLADIGLSESIPIPVGDTGFFIDSLSGSLQNLNNPSQLVVMASAEVSFGKTVTVPSFEPIFAGGKYALVDATGSITISASELDLSGSVSLVGGLLGQGSASLDLNWTTGVYMVSGNFSMYDGIINFGGSLTVTSAGDSTVQAMASVNVPPQIPFIGGDSLGSVNFFLQYEAGAPLTQDVVAAWTSVNLFFTTFTIGFEIDFQGDVSIINGNDVAALSASVMSQPQPSQYVYQQGITVPSQVVAGSDPVGAQITASSPVFDGAYPVTVATDNVSANYNGSPGHYYSDFQLTNSYVILSTLTFGVTVDQDVIPGGVFAGTGSFDSKGNFVFTPSGQTSIVPNGATLYSDGLLALTWSAIPFGSIYASINATYDAANAHFELMQQTYNGTNYDLANYSIDPVTNSSTDPVQAAIPAESVATDQGLTGNEEDPHGQGIKTVYTLQQGQADQKTVTFTLYSGGTLLGNGYFDSSGGFHFVKNGNSTLAPTNGFTTTNLGGDGLLELAWTNPPPDTTANVTYASIGNRLIDFNLSNEQAPDGIPGQYVISLVTNSPLASNDVPSFSEWDQYQVPTIALGSGTLAVSTTGALTGTLLANSYTAAAQNPGDTSSTVTLYYNSTDSTTNGNLIATYDYSQFTTGNVGAPRSFNFSWPGFDALPAGSYYIYAVINDGQNQPQSSEVAGPFSETAPTPALSVPSYVALTPTAGIEQGVLSAAADTALGITTNFTYPVTVELSVASGGNLIVSGGIPTTDYIQTYPSAAAAVAALDGLEFVADSTFTGSTALSFKVTTELSGTAFQAEDDIPLLTPNTHLVVTQSAANNIPGNLSDELLTLTVTNPGGPDGRDGTNVQVANYLSPGFTVISSSASAGSFDPTTGLWTVGALPITGANSATLTLTLEAGPAARGSALTSTSVATSDLYNYPKSDATNLLVLPQPQAVTFTVTSLSDDGAGSLRSAIASAENGDTIQFSPTLVGGTIVLSSGELLINQNLTIVGPTTLAGNPGIVVSGNNASRIFDVEGGASGIEFTLENLAIENGLANAQSPSTASAGGGLLINDAGGNLTLNNLLISGNIAQGAAGLNAQGGGVVFLGGTATLSDSTLENNQATGAVGSAGLGAALDLTAGNLTLIADTITNNQASGGEGGQGGGLSVTGGILTLNHATLAGNSATVGGDLYQSAPGFVEALNSVFATGTATSGPDVAGTVGFTDHNVIDNTGGSVGFSAASGDVLNVSADLAPLGNYNGTTSTLPPLPGSPTLNAADAGLVPTQSIPGLVTYLEGEGNALDTENNNNGTITGGVTYTQGVVGQAFQLDGTDGAITVADSGTLDTADFTVGGWFNVSQAPSAGSEYYLASKYDGNGHGWILRLSSSLVPTLSVNASTSANVNAVSSQSLSLNTWYYLSATFDGTAATLSINGTAVASATLTGGYVASATPLVLGAASWYSGGFFSGAIDQFSYFNRALTTAEQRSLPLTGTAESELASASLVGLYGDNIGASAYQYDLAITVSGPASVSASNLIPYTLTLTNNGPTSVAGATLTDVLPQGVVFESITGAPGWTVSTPAVGQGGTVTATDSANLAPGATVDFTLVVQSNDTTPGTVVVANTASVGPTTFDTNSGNNTATTSSKVTVPTPTPTPSPSPTPTPTPSPTPTPTPTPSPTPTPTPTPSPVPVPVTVPAGTATSLAFQGEPGNAVIGQTISPAITVNVVDGNGNTVSTGPAQSVTLSIASGPAGATLGGTTTVLAVNGVATFTNVTLSVAGNYTLVAKNGTLTAAVSSAFTVAPVPVTTGLMIRREALRQISRRGRPLMVAQTIKITNKARKAQSGPLALEVQGLVANAALANAIGTDRGNPYIDIVSGNKTLAPGKSVSITLDLAVSGQTKLGRQALYNSLEAFLGLE